MIGNDQIEINWQFKLRTAKCLKGQFLQSLVVFLINTYVILTLISYRRLTGHISKEDL